MKTYVQRRRRGFVGGNVGPSINAMVVRSIQSGSRHHALSNGLARDALAPGLLIYANALAAFGLG